MGVNLQILADPELPRAAIADLVVSLREAGHEIAHWDYRPVTAACSVDNPLETEYQATHGRLSPARVHRLSIDAPNLSVREIIDLLPPGTPWYGSAG